VASSSSTIGMGSSTPEDRSILHRLQDAFENGSMTDKERYNTKTTPSDLESFIVKINNGRRPQNIVSLMAIAKRTMLLKATCALLNTECGQSVLSVVS